MIISSGSGNDAMEISVCGYAHDADGKHSYHQAVKEFNYNWYWNDDEQPSVHVYRLGSVINKQFQKATVTVMSWLLFIMLKYLN